MITSSHAAVADWLKNLLNAEAFQLDHVSLASSNAWKLQDGIIQHQTGRFFSVIGVSAVNNNGTIVQQPMLDQREIGTLAFIIRQRAETTELLVQAKAEPGNIGTIQLAPSFQATASNAARIHGGAPPPLHNWFGSCGQGTLIADGLQSEQGTRFFGKRNRNCTLLISGEVEHGQYHHWIPIKELCALLVEDHLLNTDARSALVCSDWNLLASGKPFSGGGFAEELRASLKLTDTESWKPLTSVLSELEKPAPWRKAPQMQSLERLHGWRLEAEGLETLTGKPFCLRHVRVNSLSREVSQWDQPIVQSAARGYLGLPMGRWQTVPHFLFRAVSEPGFGSRIELTPGLIMEPDTSATSHEFMAALMDEGHEIISCMQSEEGGRFLFDENRYALLDVGEIMQPPPDYHWLSLAQIRLLLTRGECITNEARSALSLLLNWL